jgi:hypothetical protein
VRVGTQSGCAMWRISDAQSAGPRGGARLVVHVCAGGATSRKNFAVPAHSNVAHAWRLGARSRRNGAWRRRSEQWIGLRPPAIVELRSHVEHGSDPVRPASQSDALAQPRQITAAASPSQPIALQTPRLQISISAPRFGRPNSCRFCISYIQTGHCERTTPPRGI